MGGRLGVAPGLAPSNERVKVTCSPKGATSRSRVALRLAASHILMDPPNKATISPTSTARNEVRSPFWQYGLFPFPPALSRGEREHSRQSFGEWEIVEAV